MKKPGRNFYIFLIFLLILTAFIAIGIVASNFGIPAWGILLMYIAMLAAMRIIFRSTYLALRGNFFYITGNNKAARPLLKKAIELNTKSPRAYLNYSVMILREERNTAEAFEYLNKAMKLKRLLLLDEKAIMLTLGTCYWLDGQIDKAIEIIKEMQNKYEYVNPSVLTTLGFLYLLNEDYENAIKATEAAIADDSSYASAWDNLGQIYYKQGDIEKARENFEKAIELRESLVDSLYFMGLISENTGENKMAKEYFRKASLCDISQFNTVTQEQIAEKCQKYGIEQG